MRTRKQHYKIRRMFRRIKAANRIMDEISSRSEEPYLYHRYNSAIKRSDRLTLELNKLGLYYA